MTGAPPPIADRSTTVRAVLRLAGPAIAQSLLHTLVFLVNRAMLGRHADASLASMQISGPIVWTSVAVLGAPVVGAVALVGRAVGAGDRALASAAARASLGLGVAVGLVAGAVGLLAMPLVLSLFPVAGADVQGAASGYLGVFLPTLPLFLVSFTAAGILAASGDTRTPFAVAAGGNVVNVVLNWVLIFGHLGSPAFGTRGAAIASAAAMAFQSLCFLLLLLRPHARLTLRGGGDARLALSRMLRVSLPALGERIVQQLGFLGFVAMIGALGATAMAANQALVSIEAVCFLSADGFGIAAAAIVAQRLGARRPDEAAFGARVATALAVSTLGAFAISFLVVPELLIGAFTDDGAIVALAAPCMIVAAAAQPFMAIGVVLGEALRGAGATRAAFGVTIAGGLVVRLAATWGFAFAADLGLPGVWLGSTADWIVRAGIAAWVVRRGGWRDMEV